MYIFLRYSENFFFSFWWEVCEELENIRYNSFLSHITDVLLTISFRHKYFWKNVELWLSTYQSETKFFQKFENNFESFFWAILLIFASKLHSIISTFWKKFTNLGSRHIKISWNFAKDFKIPLIFFLRNTQFASKFYRLRVPTHFQ